MSDVQNSSKKGYDMEPTKDVEAEVTPEEFPEELLTFLRPLYDDLNKAIGEEASAALLAQIPQIMAELQANPAAYQDRFEEAFRNMRNAPELEAIKEYMPTDHARRAADALALIAKLAETDTKSGTALKAIPPLTSSRYDMHTGEESNAVGQSFANAKSGTHWRQDLQDKTATFGHAGLPHTLVVPSEVFENLKNALSATGIFAYNYIVSLLVDQGSGWVDLNDVARRMGRDPQTKEDYAKCRNEVLNFITYGDKAVLIGARNSPYKDKSTGKTISTDIHSALWKITDTRKPSASEPEYGETPVAVHLALSAQLQFLVQSSDTRQYLPFCEILGSIPGKKPSGAYARVIGLTLLHFFRRSSHYALGGRCFQTRRELLMTFPPEEAPPLDVLASKNPGRLIEHYYDALGILRDLKIVAPTGDADPKKNRREGLSAQGWHSQFLDAIAEIHPGAVYVSCLEAVAEKRFIGKPKQLVGAKRGRKPKAKTVAEVA